MFFNKIYRSHWEEKSFSSEKWPPKTFYGLPFNVEKNFFFLVLLKNNVIAKISENAT